MPPTIRPATRADEADVQRVIKAVYDEYGFTWDPAEYHADLFDLDAYYFDAGDRFAVAEEDGSVLGTVAIEFFPTIPGPTGTIVEHEGKRRVAGCDCSLERLYVAPEARRRGIGSSLTEWAIREARNAEKAAMELWSDKRFGDAHRLYGRFGAVVVGDRICDDPDISPEWGLYLPFAAQPARTP